MFDSLRNLILGGNKASKSLAKSRLHFVLVQDRTGLSAENLASFKREMVEVIERYFVVDQNAFDISYERAGDLTKLVINSPVIVRRQDSKDLSAGARGKGSKSKVKPGNNGAAANTQAAANETT